jgi:hypothetical protein
MLAIAAILFAVAAVGGVTMLALHLRKDNLPLPLALVHGAFAAAGLVVLILAVLLAGASAVISVVLFVVAALGGFFLFALYLRGSKLPTPLILVHGGVAVVAFLILLAVLLGL